MPQDANRASQETRVVVDTGLGPARDTTPIVWSRNGITDGFLSTGLGAEPEEARNEQMFEVLLAPSLANSIERSRTR